MFHEKYRENISSSEFLVNNEKMFLQYYMHSDVFVKYIWTYSYNNVYKRLYAFLNAVVVMYILLFIQLK